MKIVMIVSLACLLGCPQTPPNPPPTPDASDASAFGDSPPSLDACQQGCAALTAVNCPLSTDASDCAGFLRVLNDQGKEPNAKTHKPLTCADVAAVKTKDDARALGFVCP